MRRSFLLVLVMLTAMSVFGAPPSKQLIDKVIKTYGGEQAWKKVAGLRESGKVLSAMQGEGTVVRTWQNPDKLRIEIDYADNHETRVVSGLSGWRDGEPVGGPQLDAMILQRARIALPLLLIRHRADLRDLGTGERNGKIVHILQVPMTSYMNTEVEIDETTAQIVRSVGRAAIPGTTAQIEFIAVYDDFRKVGGLLFPFHEDNFASGHHTGVTSIEKIEILKSVPTETFRP